ncbi:uncharacterized protein LOC124936772 [Impatiens glandulifera]|uniref:uncharacterized protein LOC124936772 n=1 Tax=Impatiens glandulifera TaxID=253017 RepID=UPI001FB1073B|nr:uncharacterized protein LOC124936772 [Impatiens glandulifera]
MFSSSNTPSFKTWLPLRLSRHSAPTLRILHVRSVSTNDLAVQQHPHLNSLPIIDPPKGKYDPFPPEPAQNSNPPEAAGGGEGDGSISGIQVPRQGYISVPNSELLDSILLMFETVEEVDQFLLLSACLDSVLHAEHKIILEGMRRDFNLIDEIEKKPPQNGGSHEQVVTNDDTVNSTRNDTRRIKEMEEEELEGYNRTNGAEAIFTDFRLDLGYLFGSSTNTFNDSSNKSRIDGASRFQDSFVQLLKNAQFEELSVRDLSLTSALNSDYLLTLPIYVDWKKASESNAIIFRRGYTTERQKGFLIGEKLDYLQSKLLRAIFSTLAKPSRKIGLWINEAIKNANWGHDAQVWIEKVNLWLKELPLLEKKHIASEYIFDSPPEVGKQAENDSPVWLKAQRAVARYEGILSSVGPRGRLLRKLLIWIGIIPSSPTKDFDSDISVPSSEPYLRPSFIPRITLGDIWEPATMKRCGNDILKMLKVATSILFSRSILQEPAFRELIILYREANSKGKAEDKEQVASLQLKIYERISIPDLPVVFPHKKLSFRILDTVRLDIASVLGLLAFVINYKFENILSSPSALLLDVITTSTLILYVTRVAFGYKQTWDRYQLLVNRTLYEKTLASGFGSVYFLLDASEQQQYKEAILAYAMLLKAENSKAICEASIKDQCERFMYNTMGEKVEMPIDKALNTLVRLGLVTEENNVDHERMFNAVPCATAYNILKQHWNLLLHDSG